MIDEKTGESLKYDVIVLGTGLKECILSGLLSVAGKKVLHMDRNGFYGAESASFNLTQAHENLGSEQTAQKDSEEYKGKVGSSKQYNIDLCPKLLMAGGNLTKMLLLTKVTKYLEFKSVGGSYVYQAKTADTQKLCKVPTTGREGYNSDLMGLKDKKRFGDFLSFVNKIDLKDTATWKASGLGWSKEFDIPHVTPQDVYDYFKLTDDAIVFIGHAICLYPDDSYRTRKFDVPGDQTQQTEFANVVTKMKLYLNSLLMYKESMSPYLYPLWGLGGLPEGFSRLAAVYGGVYMLRRPIESIGFGDDGKVKSVTSNGETAFCDILIADPSYFKESHPGKIKSSGFVARSIMILDRPVPGVSPELESAQIIFPSNYVKDHDCDIYVSMVGFDLQCAPQGRFVAVASTKVPTGDEAEAQSKLNVVRSWIKSKGGAILDEFKSVRETFVAINQQEGDNSFICSSPDHTTHFQNATQEVQNIYHAIMGEPLDLSNVQGDDEE